MAIIKKNKKVLEQLEDSLHPEANIAKFANILFIPPSAKNLYETRRFDFEKRITNGERISASIEIRPAKDYRNLTVYDQKILYALFQLWEDKGKPSNGKFSFSGREMARVLGIKSSGMFEKRLKMSLDVLRNTSLTWMQSYDTKEYTKKLVSGFSILNSAQYLDLLYRNKENRFDGMNTVTFNEYITENLLTGKTKPFLLKEMLSISGYKAAALYTALDVFLAKATIRELTATKIIKEILHLDGKRYQYKYIRKQELLNLIKALQGKKISNGAVLQLEIAETTDKSDWKLVIRAVPPSKKGNKSFLKLINDDSTVEILISDIRRATGIRNEDEPLKFMAQYYPEGLLFKAMSLYKADYKHNGIDIKNPIALFQGILHGIAHENGFEWIFGCGKDCKHRPENKRTDNNDTKQSISRSKK